MTLRRRLRDAYAMPTHSVHSRTLRKGFTRASIRSSVDCTLLFCSLPNERKRLWVKFRFLPSSRWTGVILQNCMAKRMRIYALTAAILTKYGKTRFTISRRTTPSPCWTNGGKTIQTSAILRKPPPTIQIISTGYCVCGLWMRLSYIPCLSYRERDGISSSRHYLKHAGHSPHKRVIPTECIGASTHAWKP